MELHYSIYLFFLISLFNPIFTLSLRSSLSPRHQNLSPSLLARDNRITATPSTPTRKILTKRDWRTMRNVFAAVQYIGNGWSLHFRSLDICHTNVDFAASELLDFYNQVLAAALPAWSRQPPATAHGATLGDVSIHFRSDVPIPWDFIHSYLLAAIGQMRATPGNTVVASYKVALVSVIHTAPIWVELVLPWAGAAAAA